MGNAQPPLKTYTVLAEYVKLRQKGMTAAEALRNIQDTAAEQIGLNERVQLGGLIKDWEAREGSKLRAAIEPPPRPVQPASLPMVPPAAPFVSQTAPTVYPSAPPAAPKNVPSINISGNSITCSNCNKLNPRESAYCYACGYMLKPSRAATRALIGSDEEAQAALDNARFGRHSKMLMYIDGVANPIELEPADEIVIGRITSDGALRPDIDLNPYNAENLGVSRLHASIKRHENTVLISDMNSINHTFVNGQMLHPQEVLALRDGDEIRLGRLTMHIKFKAQLRRL